MQGKRKTRKANKNSRRVLAYFRRRLRAPQTKWRPSHHPRILPSARPSSASWGCRKRTTRADIFEGKGHGGCMGVNGGFSDMPHYILALCFKKK
ncbi:hypothetical protein I7I53_07515 [Histoplasma capsulatum var. duboisii H88]|uniref:Uncharacterized protein n=1 Tax=Ajellomyces capsulatus (strain H88) TaxID=544711 RepID=A0A8A1LEP1_AJEC8|nr:hypothetical protein I7I53_07515 [Histoplasma capsulatum var. duboisii H88]